MTFFTNSKKYAKKIKKAEKCVVYENTVRELFSCEQFKKGAEAKKQCNVSCIGCGICEKTCTAGAIKVKDNCAVIEESICLSCGMCAVKCPRHVIHDLHGILTEIR